MLNRVIIISCAVFIMIINVSASDRSVSKPFINADNVVVERVNIQPEIISLNSKGLTFKRIDSQTDSVIPKLSAISTKNGCDLSLIIQISPCSGTSPGR